MNMNKPVFTGLAHAVLLSMAASAAMAAEPPKTMRLDEAALDNVTAGSGSVTLTTSSHTSGNGSSSSSSSSSSSVSISSSSSTTTSISSTTVTNGDGGTTTVNYKITEDGQTYSGEETITGPNQGISVIKEPGKKPQVKIDKGAATTPVDQKPGPLPRNLPVQKPKPSAPAMPRIGLAIPKGIPCPAFIFAGFPFNR